MAATLVIRRGGPTAGQRGNLRRTILLGADVGKLLLKDGFDYPNGVVANEYAESHPGEPGIHVLPLWEITSGTLFARDGSAYSGLPDNGWDEAGHPAVDIDSVVKNGSSVLRAITKQADFLNVSVQFKVTKLQLVSTPPRTPAKKVDGLHVFIRRQTEHNTYYVDVSRRDNVLTMKKKLPDPSTGFTKGKYYPLGDPVPFELTFGTERSVRVDASSFANGFVSLRLYIDGSLVHQVVDCSPDAILTGGATGIRGDNCEFTFDDFEVWSL